MTDAEPDSSADGSGAVGDGAGDVRSTDRWRGLGAAVLLAAALGAVTRTPALLSVAAAGVALLAYARVIAPPPASLALSRTVAESDDPEEPVTVTLTVENVGERTIPELRLVDGVPTERRIVDGAASVGTALAPGQSATVTYDLEGRPGRHDFRPATVLVRDVAGVVERRTDIEAAGDEAAGRPPSLRRGERIGLRAAAARYAGTHTTDDAGSGVAFRAVREYRRGDPVSRIDWRRRARTGELATVEFHAERSVPVVLVIDDRPAAAVVPEPGAETAVEASSSAARLVYAGVIAAGHRVGVATLGPAREWLPPGRGPTQDARVGELLSGGRSAATEAAGDGPAGSDRSTDDDAVWLRDRLPPDAELVVLTPACDGAAVSLARRLDAAGRPVSVCSFDPTGAGGGTAEPAGRSLVRLERRQRLDALRAAGVSVVEWGPGESVERALARARWRS